MSSRPALTQPEVSMLMRFALAEAERGLRQGEIPIGCVVAVAGEHGLRIVGRGFERGTQHAVAEALGAARGKLRPGETDFVIATTVEPCVACMGAIEGVNVRELVYGIATTPKTATLGSGTHRLALSGDPQTRVTVTGVMAHDCKQLLSTFVERGMRSPATTYAEQLLRLPAPRTHAA